MIRLFTYGTLTRKHRMEALVGRKLEDPKNAVLYNYERFATPHGYPIILPKKGEKVEGHVWEVEEGDLGYIDHYEGCDEDPPFYFRRTEEVMVNGQLVSVCVYVGNPDIYWGLEK